LPSNFSGHDEQAHSAAASAPRCPGPAFHLRLPIRSRPQHTVEIKPSFSPLFIPSASFPRTRRQDHDEADLEMPAKSRLARSLHSAMIPTRRSFYTVRKFRRGDYYDASIPPTTLRGGQLMLVMADVAGKSVPALSSWPHSKPACAPSPPKASSQRARHPPHHYACAKPRRPALHHAVLAEYDPPPSPRYVNAGTTPRYSSREFFHRAPRIGSSLGITPEAHFRREVTLQAATRWSSSPTE